MIEQAEEMFKPLISTWLMKHKNKQEEKLGEINETSETEKYSIGMNNYLH